MIIPIPIFIQPKSKEELEAEIRYSNFYHNQELKWKVREEMKVFKDRFRNQDIIRSPEAAMMFNSFGHNDVDKLTLKDLLLLGFQSVFITRNITEEDLK